MIVFVEEVSQGCIINLPQGSNQWEKTYVSFQGRQTTLCKLFTGSKKQNILTAMELSISSWKELLHFVEGALETSKYA